MILLDISQKPISCENLIRL